MLAQPVIVVVLLILANSSTCQDGLRMLPKHYGMEMSGLLRSANAANILGTVHYHTFGHLLLFSRSCDCVKLSSVVRQCAGKACRAQQVIANFETTTKSIPTTHFIDELG